jgi:hypothetical protein
MDVPEVRSEYSAPKTPLPGSRRIAVAEPPPASFGQALLRGAKVGRRVLWCVGMPLGAIAFVLGLFPTALGLGAGRGFSVHPLSIGGVGVYAGGMLLGSILGVVIGVLGFVRRRLRDSSKPDTLWGRMNRPVRLTREAPPDAEPIDSATPPELPTTRPRRARWVRFVGILVGVLLALAFGVGAYLGWDLDRGLADAMAGADREDPHWRLSDLMAAREKVPIAENSAVLVARAAAALPLMWPEGPDRPFGSPVQPPSAISVGLEALEATESNIRLDRETVDALRSELAKFASAVDDARRVAGFARGRHELRLTRALINTSLKETVNARRVARLLAADSAIRAEDSDCDAALASCLAIINVGRSIGDEPFLISALVRAAIGRIGMKPARRVLAQGEPSDEQLSKLQSLLLVESGEPLLLRGVRGERAILDENIRRVRDAEIPTWAIAGVVNDDVRANPVPSWGKLGLDRQRLFGLRWMRRLVEVAKQPASARPALWKQWDDFRAQSRADGPDPLAPVLALQLIPELSRSDEGLIAYQAELSAMTTLLAAERYRRKTGRWPVSIAAIDPPILPSAPLDPNSDKPFLLKRDDDEGSLVVYSIGRNLLDEQGDYDPKMGTLNILDDVGAKTWDPARRRQPPTLRKAEADVAPNSGNQNNANTVP